ncbi:MAG: hypothetical protein ACI9MC_003978 [Kiritimatiellia bacterium]
MHALRHPAIVRIAGFGEDPTTELMWLAMELVHGEDIEQMLVRHAFHREQVPAFFGPIADGLSYAHARGIAHRDIKPANLMLQSGGLPVLLDFGIAVQEGQDRLTQDGVMPGTVAYAAPEQVMAGAANSPVLNDTYALGQVMFECLTGSFTFSRDASVPEQRRVMQILRSKMKAKPLDPGPLFADRVRSLVRSATEPDPSRRGPPLEEWSAILQQGPLFSSPGPASGAVRRSLPPTPLLDPSPNSGLRVSAQAAHRPMPASHAAPMSEEVVRVRAFPPPKSDFDPKTIVDLTLEANPANMLRPKPRSKRRFGCVALLVGLLAVGLLIAGGTAIVGGGLVLALLLSRPAQAPPAPTLGDGIMLEDPAVDALPVEVPAPPEPTPPVRTRRSSARVQPKAVSSVRTDDSTGLVVISADASSAVTVDGKYLQQAPVQVRLSPGDHAVVVVSGEGRRREFSVHVEAGEVVKRAWSFERAQWHSFEGGMHDAALPLRPKITGLQARFDALRGVPICLRDGGLPRQRLRFTVVADGSVVAEGLDKSAGSPVEACLNRAVHELSFEPSRAGAAVQVWVGE